MAKVRVATFNVENLFARWKFKAGIDPDETNERGWIVEEQNFEEVGEDNKVITGLAFMHLACAIVCWRKLRSL